MLNSSQSSFGAPLNLKHEVHCDISNVVKLQIYTPNVQTPPPTARIPFVQPILRAQSFERNRGDIIVRCLHGRRVKVANLRVHLYCSVGYAFDKGSIPQTDRLIGKFDE